MYVMILDTETSGLPEQISYNTFYPPANINRYKNARVAQLAFQICDAKTGKLIHQVSRYVKPIGWAMTPGATAVNKLTDKFLTMAGLPIYDVLSELYAWMSYCHSIVGHNIIFDINVLQSEMIRLDMPIHIFDRVSRLCTMRAGKVLFGKNIRLTQLYKKITGKNMIGAHDALGDVCATSKIYFAISPC
jgi:DNA polymerase III subunit alpha